MEAIDVIKTADSLTKDKFTLRVRGNPVNGEPSTNPKGLARSILHVFNDNPIGYVKLESVGRNALDIAMAAYRIARGMFSQRTTDFDLVVIQSEYTAEINGAPTRGVCTRIFPIPISNVK